MNVGLFSRAAGIAVLALMLVAGSFLIVMPDHAGAALSDFEIDGNIVAASGPDWDSLPPSTGNFDPGEVLVINDQNYAGSATVTDPHAAANSYCVGSDDLIVKNGTKLTDFPFVPIDGSPSPGKNDICQTYLAYDLVSGGGSNEIILYVGVVRRETNGTTAVAVELNKVDQANRQIGDLVVSFEFDGNGPVAVVNIREWNGSGFDLTAVGGTANAEGYSTDHFGEIAVNLTATGILPPPESPEDCATLGTVLPFGWAGNSDTSNIGDWGGSAPLGLDLCGKLIVEKETQPTGGTQTFNYSLSTDADFSPLIGSLDGDGAYAELLLPDGDYTLVESDPFGVGWAFKSYSCDDGSSGTIRQDGVTVPVSLGTTVTCTITNVQPAISVVKTADPVNLSEPGGLVTFTFTVVNTGPEDVSLFSLVDDQFGDLTVASGSDCSLPQDLAADGASYTCTLQQYLDSGDFSNHVNTVVASARDAAGLIAEATDDAIVSFDDLPSSIEVVKTADPTSVAEPGGSVTYTFVVNNTSAVDSVDIDTLDDSIYGDLNGQGDCSVPQTIAAGGSYSCSITVDVSGNAGDTILNVVTASGFDDDGNPVSDSDDALVTITDVPSSIEVVKLATPGTIAEPGGDVTFDVSVLNTSAVDTVLIDSLVDSIFGDLNGQGDCAVPQTLAPGESYECSFDYFIAGNYDDIHTNVVTASGFDDDGNPVSDNDDAVVRISDVESSIDIVKTANPTSVAEPGGIVTFSIEVFNTSLVDAISISTLVDDVFGDLNGQGDCLLPQTVAAGASYECSFTGPVEGNAGYEHINTVVVSATDDDGNPLTAEDAAEVVVTDVPSSISVIKTPSVDGIAEPGGTVTFAVVVENTSETDMLIVASLIDDIYGDLNGQGDCELPQKLAVGETYTCSFDGEVTGNAGDTHVNIVTVTAEDDDGDFIEDDDDAEVLITDVASGISVTKTADQPAVQEPGGLVAFTVVVTNESTVDTVTINSLVDDVFGDLNGQGDCSVPQVLTPGASYTCTFDGDVVGEAGSDDDPHVNTVTVDGTDDDGNEVTASDDETVDITEKPTGTIGDFVWNDTDEDGIQDPNEVGVEGVLVELIDADTDEVIASQTTGADGAYEFTGVEEGDYYLRFTTPKSWEFGLVDQGDDQTLDSDAVFKSGEGEEEEHFEIAETVVFSLDAGEVNNTIDAGMIKIFVSPQVITTTTTVPSTLPFTGFGHSDAAGMGVILMALGGFVILALRRKEEESFEAVPVHPAWEE